MPHALIVSLLKFWMHDDFDCAWEDRKEALIMIKEKRTSNVDDPYVTKMGELGSPSSHRLISFCTPSSSDSLLPSLATNS